MKHLDSASHTRGESQYVDDMPRPVGLLYAAVVGSPSAHGRIKALKLKKALGAPGVVAIFTAADIPGENQIGQIIQDETLLAEDTVHYIGEPLAVIVAETAAVAHRAVKIAEVEIEELPVITDPREAFAKQETIGPTREFVLGDVEAAWEQCEVIVEGRADVAGQEHVYLETQRARAIPLEDRTLRVYASSQGPYAVQKTVAGILGVPHHKIEVDIKRLGGGFGGKEDQATPWACFVALAAWKLQRPVELVLGRADDIRMTGKRHPYSSDFRLGATRDGQLLAYEVRHYQNAGAAADLSPAVLERTMFHSTNAYFIPNVHIFGACCRTNLPPNTAFRGFGGPQAMFVVESAITKLSEELRLPREEIQRKNLLKDGDLFPYGQVVEQGRAEATWEEADRSFKFGSMRNRVEKYNQNHFETKKGLAVMPICFGISFTATFLNQASSLMHVYTDGSISVSTGGVEMGQGLITNIAAIAARALGVHAERIKVESTNTTRIANMSQSAASATTDLNGHATILAAVQILERLKKFAARELNLADPEKVTVENEKVLYDGKETEWDWSKLVRSAYLARIGLSAHGFYSTPNIWFDKQKEKGRPFAYHVFGTAVFEVTVDCLRGTYDINSAQIVHDMGRPINAIVDLGQVEGGLAQGLGWMTVEELKFNEKGQYLSNSLAAYKLPDVYFTPQTLNVKFLEKQGNPESPYGTKAVGEPPLMYGIGVYFALRHAIRAFNPSATLAFDAPMTPEKALMQLHQDVPEDVTPKEAVEERDQSIVNS